MKKVFIATLVFNSFLFIVTPLVIEAYFIEQNHVSLDGNLIIAGFILWIASAFLLLSKIDKHNKRERMKAELYAAAFDRKWSKANERQKNFQEMCYISCPHSFSLTIEEIEEIANAF